MSQPTNTDIHVDAALTNVSLASMNPMDVFVADKVFPKVPTTKESDKYFIYDQDYLLKSEARERADKTPAHIRGHEVTTDTFTTKEYSIAELVSDKERRNADPAINPDQDASAIVTQDLMIKKEALWAAVAFVASQWTTDATPSVLWDVPATSDPIIDVETAKGTITDKIGIPGEMLTGVIAGPVWRVLKRHPDILNAFGGGNAGLKVATVDMVRDLLGLKNLFVANAVQNTAIEKATGVFSQILADNMLIVFVPSTPSPRTASGGYTFSFNDLTISRFRKEDLKSDQIEGSMQFDQKLTMADAGYLIEQPIT